MQLKNIFLKGKMNKDQDERLVPNGEFIHAENINVVKSEGSDSGAVENLLGNKKLTDINFGPNAECIGGIADESEKVLYWMVKSDTGSFIMEYNHGQKVVTTVLEDIRTESILNFDKSHLITGVNIIVDTDSGNRFLLFTDDLNPPRCVNIERAKTYGANNFGQDEISLIKRPPIFPPSITPYEDDDTDENNLSDRFISFAYRNKYIDGEYSALSPFTQFAFLPKTFDFDFATNSNESMVNSYKEVKVEFNTGDHLVTGIEVVFKESGSNNVYLVEEFDKKAEGWSDNDYQSVLFSNNKVTKVLPEDELFRIYDNVPLKAKSQEVVANRVVYGNYTENYDLLDRDGKKIKVDLKLETISNNIVPNTATPSIKSNRDYEAAIAYLDEYGRMTTVLTSEGNTQHIPVSLCTEENKFKLAINHKPPAFAKYYRVFLKQNKENYNTVVSTSFHQDGAFVWVKLGPSDLNKFKEGDYLVVKSDTKGVTDQYIETRVIEIRQQPENFLLRPSVDEEEEEESDSSSILPALIAGGLGGVGGALAGSLLGSSGSHKVPKKELVQESGIYFKLKPVNYRIDDADFQKYNWEVHNSSKSDSVNYEANYIEKPSYYGNGGLNDLSTTGNYIDDDTDRRYIVEIESTSSEGDTFRWSDDDGQSFKTVSIIAGNPHAIGNGVNLVFENATGHSRNDRWVIPAKGRHDNGFGGGDGSDKGYLIIKGVDGDVIEGGARISFSYEEYGDKNKSFSGSWTSSRRYDNLEEWFYGENIDEDFKDQFNGYWFRRGSTNAPGTRTGRFYQSTDGTGTVCLIIRSIGTQNNFLDENAKMDGNLSILQSKVNLIFETKDTPVSSDIYYELGRTYRIYNGLHMGHGTDRSQSVSPAVLTLPFYNCFSWGNGFESYRIKDSITDKAMYIDSRPLGKIKDYRQNHRRASLTYSGVYEQSMNYNSLNEFNLSLANYKDMDDSHGSIQKLYSRDGNLMVLQENKVSQVMVNKSVLYNADGSSNVQQSTEILGQDVPYDGIYGISKEPESFVANGSFIGWVDSVRGVVMKLGGNGLFPISNWGMRSYFRDFFKDNSKVKAIGGYDPYMDKVVLSMSPKEVSNLLQIQCGQELMKFNQTEAFTYKLVLDEGAITAILTGNAFGTITIEGTVHEVSGDFSIEVPVDKTTLEVTVKPSSGTYVINHECEMPVEVVPEVIPPVETETYYGYLAIECPTGQLIRYPKIITSPEILNETYSDKTVVIDGVAYTFYDVSSYSVMEDKGALYLKGGNTTRTYPSCTEAAGGTYERDPIIRLPIAPDTL